MKRSLYGFLGFLSLLGFIGVFTPEKSFLAFFAFACDFLYFFVPADEMLVEYMNRSAARAFFLGMLAMALTTLFSLLSAAPGKALAVGLSVGWAASVIVYSLSSAYYGFRESWAARDD